ncbi:MAG TPA: caspase family protein [Acidobacteriaceae bacterium]
MNRNLYGLLVGIDRYPAPIPALSGCVNDIRAIEAFLNNRTGTQTIRPDLKVLLNEQATRQAVIDGFLQHLGQAGKDDVVLFYYSGHGSQERTPPEFWYLEPDRLDETLVCYDSRVDEGYDLADKEIARLIAHVAKSDPHILIVLDCCHSGSGTRELADSDGAKVRRLPTDVRVRSADSFLLTPSDARPGDGQPVQHISGTSWFLLPRGRHVVLSACRNDEEAKETSIDGAARGLFSLFLSQALADARAGRTYRDIYKRVNAFVRARSDRQSPVIEATDTADLDKPFLGGAIRAHVPYFTVSFDKVDGWIIDGGAVHGIPSPSGIETAILAVFPASLELANQNNLDGQIGDARVTGRMAATSKVLLRLNAGEPDPHLTYRAILTGLPLPPLGVVITGDSIGAGLVRQALSQAGPGGQPSLLVREMPESPELRVTAFEAGYRITRAQGDRPLAVDIEQVNQDSARKAVDRLEHIARWIRIAELRNPSTRLPAGAVSLDLFQVSETGEERKVDPATEDPDLRFVYIEQDGALVPPKFKIRVKNNSKQRLYCMLLDLPETFGVFSGLLDGNGVWLLPDEEAWARADGNWIIPATIPDKLREQGITELKDILKVIASTEPCDATLLDQDDLDVQSTRGRGIIRGAVSANTLDRLMQRVQTRNFGAAASSGRLADWMTAEVSVTTVSPRESVPVPQAGGSIELAPGVTLMGHARLDAQVRLGSEVAASRDVNLPRLPPWLVDDPQVVEPFQLSVSRGGPALSTLDLDEVAGTDAVTPDAPLQLRIVSSLSADENLLPVAFDGEFFLPLGWAEQNDNTIEVNLERLPQPLVNKRTLKGSIRILFKKVRGKYLGTQYDYPLLAAVTPRGEGEVKYVTAIDEVKKRVAPANRILLYVHGIIGDTRAMAESAFHAPAALRVPLLRDAYDLILAFDYENLNTPIEQTARDLKKRLAAVGLTEGHGKQLHIAAHSMGGLVSRWMIEREEGYKIVQHLIMLGTPNGGSPWSEIEGWVTTLIAIGLNGLSKIPWPPTVLGTLMRVGTKVGSAVSKQKGVVEVSLAEMNPHSDFLKNLLESKDPGVRYSILAGNTSLIPLVLEQRDGQASRLKKLLSRLSPQRLLHQTTALAFFGLPNDIAVSVQAIGSVPEVRKPMPFVCEVACDHLTYFTTQAGLAELAKVAAMESISSREPAS